MFRQRKKGASARPAGTTRQSFRTQSGTSQLSDRTRRSRPPHTYHGAVDVRPAPGQPPVVGGVYSAGSEVCLGNAKLFLSGCIKISTVWRLGIAETRRDATRLVSRPPQKQTSKFTQRRTTGNRRRQRPPTDGTESRPPARRSSLFNVQQSSLIGLMSRLYQQLYLLSVFSLLFRSRSETNAATLLLTSTRPHVLIVICPVVLT